MPVGRGTRRNGVVSRALPRARSAEGLLRALRAGDEDAFATAVDTYGPGMRRFALTFVRSPADADEVVQEAWLGALRGLDRFEGRAALETWLFQIVANVAKTRAVRDARTLPFSAFASEEDGAATPAVAPERFLGPDGPYPGHWLADPHAWAQRPDASLEAAETRRVITSTIENLPRTQRLVITMRDLEGWPSAEVCNVLAISETNQRVLLHRARSMVRAALERYFAEEEL